MPRTSAKIRLQEKLKSELEDQFKLIYKNILMNSKGAEFLLQEVRNITNKTNPSRIDKINPKLLQAISSSYLKILHNNKQLVKGEDIKTLFAHRKDEWKNSQKYIAESSQFIGKLRSDAINLSLPSHDHESCEELLIYINNYFVPQVTLGERCDELILLVGKKFSNAASIEYKKLEREIKDKELITLGRIFVNACVVSSNEGDVQYLDKIINLFDFDLKTLTIKYQGATYTPMTFLLAQEAAIKEKYIDLLCNKYGLHPDYDVKRDDFAEFLNITPLMNAGLRGDYESVRLLLKYGAEINLVTSLIGKAGVVLYRTAFSIAIGSKDIDIINLFIDNGADPTIASDLFRANLEDMFGKLPSNVRLVSMLSKDGKLGSPANHEYLDKIYAIIERHYVKKILSTLDNIDAVECKEEFAVAVQPQGTVEKLVDNYIQFKQESLSQDKNAAQDSVVSIEGQFDLLLVQFCRNRSEEALHKIYQYIQENPELNFYALTSILSISEPEEVAHQVFANDPKLLHKFFTLKKTMTSVEPQGLAARDLKDMHLVQSNFKNNVYVAVAPELKAEEGYSIIENKVLSLLESCAFIKSSSHKISGIKTYGGMFKLKIGGEDLSLYTNQKYLETSTGNIFIVFDKIGNHKLKTSSNLVKTIEVESFTAIWHNLTCEAVEAPVENCYLDSVGEEYEPELVGESLLHES